MSEIEKPNKYIIFLSFLIACCLCAIFGFNKGRHLDLTLSIRFESSHACQDHLPWFVPSIRIDHTHVCAQLFYSLWLVTSGFCGGGTNHFLLSKAVMWLVHFNPDPRGANASVQMRSGILFMILLWKIICNEKHHICRQAPSFDMIPLNYHVRTIT
jgi:hypothetical protein